MSTIIDLMLAVKEETMIFYHKDTKQFDHYPFSEIERKKLSPDKMIPHNDTNNFRIPSYNEINHKEIMSFYVRESVEDREIRKQLFNILRRKEYMDNIWMHIWTNFMSLICLMILLMSVETFIFRSLRNGHIKMLWISHNNSIDIKKIFAYNNT